MLKKIMPIFLLVTLIMGLSFVPNSVMNSEISAEEKTGTSDQIKGGWYLIKGEYGGAERAETSPFQFKLFGEKHFSFLMDSGNNQWNYASTGTYEFSNGIYTETFEFSTNPDFVGVTAEWKCEIKGDTMTVEGPIKILDSSGNEAPELAGGYNTMKEIRVRAN